jgi:uncharacterized phage protein (TIGR01671 family)
MREIKFRAWNGIEFYNPILSEGLVFENYREFEDFCPADDPLMQYTGLKDKNGKEIYEGNIVLAYNPNLDDEKEVNEVIFDKGCFKLHSNKSNVIDIPIGSYKQRELEAIGNIYENPNLLEK